MTLIPSASQTVGPFFNFALTTNRDLGTLARDGARGERIRLHFRVLDGDAAPTAGDSMIELWQADAHGRYAHALDPGAATPTRISTASAAWKPTPTASASSRPSSPVRFPTATAEPRPRTSTSSSWRAGC